MGETPRHRSLVRLGVSRAIRDGATIVRAAGGIDLPEPRAIGRHAPDAEGYTRTRAVRVEAKLGPELFGDHTQAQLRDFTVVRDRSGRVPHLYLAVPARSAHDARRAVLSAGGNLGRVTIVRGVPRAKPPSSRPSRRVRKVRQGSAGKSPLVAIVESIAREHLRATPPRRVRKAAPRSAGKSPLVAIAEGLALQQMRGSPSPLPVCRGPVS